MALDIAIQMDPIESVDVHADTTFDLALEAHARGHRLWIYQPAALALRDGRLCARARQVVALRREQGVHASLAAPETIDAEVTAIIENAVAQIDGVTSISSSSNYQSSQVTAEFSPRIDINIAATDVKNAVNNVRGRLPEALEDPTVSKSSGDAGSAVMRIVATAPSMSQGELGELIERIVMPRLQAVEGVASVDNYGVRKRTIRVRMSPVEMAARGLTVEDVIRVVRTANVSAPSGTLRSGNQDLLLRAEAPAIAHVLPLARRESEARFADSAAAAIFFLHTDCFVAFVAQLLPFIFRKNKIELLNERSIG